MWTYCRFLEFPFDVYLPPVILFGGFAKATVRRIQPGIGRPKGERMLETGLRSYSTSGCQPLNRAKVSYRAGVPECLWILLPSFPPLHRGLSAWRGKHNHRPEWGGGIFQASPHGAAAGRGGQGIAAGVVGKPRLGGKKSPVGGKKKAPFRGEKKKPRWGKQTKNRQWWLMLKWLEDVKVQTSILGGEYSLLKVPSSVFWIFFFHGIS